MTQRMKPEEKRALRLEVVEHFLAGERTFFSADSRCDVMVADGMLCMKGGWQPARMRQPEMTFELQAKPSKNKALADVIALVEETARAAGWSENGKRRNDRPVWGK